MSDLNYAYGMLCTWHGPVADAKMLPTIEDGVAILSPHCPHCESELELMAEETHLSIVRDLERRAPGADALFKWSKGKCFPDPDTLENAYRQAMEE